MLRIRRTKHTSHRQIQNMVHNLKAKFGENANIQTITRSNTAYWISNGEGFFGWLNEWSDLQAVYSEVIKRRRYEKQQRTGG